MQSSITLSGLNCTPETITFEVRSEDYDTLVKFVTQAKTISCVENIFTSGVTKEEDTDDETKVSYTSQFTCNYTQNGASDADIAAAATTQAQ